MPDQAYWNARIVVVQEQIIKYEAAIDAIVTGGVETYLLDTGQSRQNVTKLDISRLQTALSHLFNRLVTIEAYNTGSGTITVRPAN